MFFLTGSTGFIGSSLLKRLGHRVRCVVRGSKKRLPRELDFFEIDSLTADTDWSGAFDGVRTVIHLAARAHILRDADPDPLVMFRQVNTAATLHLAREAASGGVKRFVFLSSIGVYGNQSSQPLSESTPTHPAEPYAVSKLEAEIGLRQIAEETGLEVTIIRAPLVYGPNAPGNFGRLADAILRGRRLPLGAIRNKRSFIALENLVDFISLCAQHPNAANETFVIADGEDVSTADLVKRMARAFGIPSRLIWVPSPLLWLGATLSGNRSAAGKLLGTLLIDSTKAGELLGWRPLIAMDEQLSKIAEGFHNGHS